MPCPGLLNQYRSYIITEILENFKLKHRCRSNVGNILASKALLRVKNVPGKTFFKLNLSFFCFFETSLGFMLVEAGVGCQKNKLVKIRAELNEATSVSHRNKMKKGKKILIYFRVVFLA